MNQQEYNKVCRELDEVRGDLIEAERENLVLINRLRELLEFSPSPRTNSYTSNLLPALYGLILGLCIAVYYLHQQILWWKCGAAYQSPSSPTVLED